MHADVRIEWGPQGATVAEPIEFYPASIAERKQARAKTI
jgi:hypothetical protein